MQGSCSVMLGYLTTTAGSTESVEYQSSSEVPSFTVGGSKFASDNGFLKHFFEESDWLWKIERSKMQKPD